MTGLEYEDHAHMVRCYCLVSALVMVIPGIRQHEMRGLPESTTPRDIDKKSFVKKSRVSIPAGGSPTDY